MVCNGKTNRPSEKGLLLPPQSFDSEAKTRGGTPGVPGCIQTRTKNIVEKVRNVFVVGEAFSI